MASQLFQKKSIDKLIADADSPGHRLRKTLGPWSLTALGIGAIIGTGIFILTGTAAAGEVLEVHSLLKAPLLDVLLHGTKALGTAGRPGAGPGIALSFLLVAIACALAGLCYAELASMIPIAGSAYTYSYATLGEIVAWIIGWDLILEYAVSNMAVAVGFSAYIDSLLRGFGIELPRKLMEPMFVAGKYTGAWFNVPGFLIVMILTVILVIGIRESAGANNFMVCVKILAILIFIVAASRFIHVSNWKPFMPNGWQGVLTGGAIVFFTYIGFDSVSTAAEECKNPQKDVPFGIIASLVICATLYVTVALVLTGVQNWQTLRNAAPVANALMALGLPNVMKWVYHRRADGHDQLHAGFSIGAGARVVRHVARRPAAAGFFQSPCALPHAAHQHLGGGIFRRHSGGNVRHWHPGGSFQHRNPVRVRVGFSGSAGAAPEATRAPALVPHAVGAGGPDSLDPLVH